jgi:hypothetical protein
VLDTTSPTFATLIYPNPYAPGLPFADTLLVVDVTTSSTQPQDWLTVWIVNEEPAETLCTHQLTEGDAVYTCHWDGRGKSDGAYEVFVSAWDRAGNSEEASYAIALDQGGPWAAFTFPTETYMTAIPDTVRGRVFDRSGIDSIGINFYSNTEYLPVSTVPGTDTLSWHVAWPESLKIEDAFRLQVYAADSLGYESTKSISLTIDMTAPDVPSFDPLPQEVSEPTISISGTSSSNDSVLVYLNDHLDNRIQCSAGGTFQSTLHLQIGTNSIYGIAKDRAGNRSSPSSVITVTYSEAVGIFVPERLRSGSRIEINLARMADLITLKMFSTDGYYISTTTIDEPELYNVLEPDLMDSDGNSIRNGPYLLVLEILYGDGTTSVEKFLVVVAR